MQIVNINKALFLKQNDTATQIDLRILDFEGNPLPLTNAQRIEVVVGVEGGRVITITPILLSGVGELSFGLDEGDMIPAGDLRLEVHIYTPEGERHVAPSKGFYKLKVQRPIDILQEEVPMVTLTYFLDEVAKAVEGIAAGTQGPQGPPGPQGPGGDVNFTTFNIDTTTGMLVMTTPDDLSGVDFTINNGYLEVIVNG